MTATLLCTVRDCRTPLVRDERRFVCERNHAFDLARSGYVNLLQPQDKRSRNPGDTSAAVSARRRFLDRGLDAPVVDAIVTSLPLDPSASLLDAGCGEGHYLGAFRTRYGCDAHGVDISIPAIDAAARRHRDCSFVVANADRFLPWSDGSFDAVTSITARLNPSEFHRVLEPGGTLLLVLPAPDDLLELRAAILGEGIQRDRVERTIEMFREGFTFVRRERITHRVRLDRAAIEEVLTGSYRGLRAREREKVAALEELDVTLSRDLLLFRSVPPR